MEPILKVENLTKSYNGLVAVDHVSFAVYPQEIFGILGPNGAGKTTTLEMIETLRTIDEGSVRLNGFDVITDAPKVKRAIGVQLQSSAFFDNLTLVELLNLFSALYYQQKDPNELLDEVELKGKANAYLTTLSGGQKQRFSIASALVNDPDIMFLDEPTTGLDPQARRHMWDLIRQIQTKGKTIILTTHYMEEAEELCDRVAIMDEGRIVALDQPDKLIDALLERGFTKEKVERTANLEDVFLDLTGKQLREN